MNLQPKPIRPWALALALAAGLAGCAQVGQTTAPAPASPATVDVKLIGFNDFHGRLEPPGLTVTAPAAGGGTVLVPAGGAAYFASAIDFLKAKNPNHAVVSAGDMIGATPPVSALFLDEPTIEAVNRMQIDFNAVGNHEFDKGYAELLRMQGGGCARHTRLEPCQVNKNFPGANFKYLAANVVTPDGNTLFPATGIKSFTRGGATVKVGFIGMTLRATPRIVSPAGVAGLRFMDEADTVNALVPSLKSQGADAIVVLLHEGAQTQVGYNDPSCTGLHGDILHILDRFDAAVDVVVSGHTHNAYICDYGRINPAKPFLLTSAGLYGTLLTEIDLRIDTRTRKVTAKSADNLIVQGEPFMNGARTIPTVEQYPIFTKRPDVAELVARYSAAAVPLTQRVVGRLARPATRAMTDSRENVLGELIADAQLEATRDAAVGGAQLALMNPGGVRTDLVPAANGELNYGQLFAAQPFGNVLVVQTFTGGQIRAALEQQFASGSNTVASPRVLLPSRSFTYSYDLSQPPGARILDMALDGQPMSDTARYRVTTNSFLAAGGDNFSVLQEGTDAVGGILELEATEAYLRAHDPLVPPVPLRIRKIVR